MKTQDIKALLDTRFGWLTPQGDLVACALHDHLSALSDVPELATDVAEHAETLSENQSRVDEHQMSLEPDEHPEMHQFSGMDDDANLKLTLAAYRLGWIRLGMRLATRPQPGASIRELLSEPANFMIEAEGLDEAIAARIGDLRDLAAITGSRLELNEMALVEVRLSGRKSPPTTMLLNKRARAQLAAEGRIVGAGA